MTTCKEAAVQGFATLVKLWSGGNTFRSPDLKGPGPGGCFWMAGNLFHTAVDCMVRTQQKDTFGSVPGTTLGQEALKFFTDATSKTPPAPPPTWGQGALGFWVDDYGWWGLALLRAYQNADFLGYTSFKDDLATNAKNCWQALHACWNNTEVSWVDPNNNQHTITGGIPNTPEDSLKLAGRNCVTNECYWLLSMYLAKTFGADGNNYLDPSTNSNNFFAQGTNPNILFNSSNGLVLERFFGMRSPSQRVSWPSTDHPDWTWLGDQGLFFDCCWNNSEYGQGNFGSDRATAIFNAVQANNVTNGVLHDDLAPYSEYQLDYACGKGTLMRYLTNRNDADHQFGGSGRFDSFFKTNAGTVWKNQLAGGLFPYYWDKESSEPTGWGYSQAIANAVLHAAGLCAIHATLWPGSSGNDPID